ncbi:MAG: Fic family protein [Flavobacteriales bacterium]|nr:Fic family protein [Flavobacteriales bacterium]
MKSLLKTQREKKGLLIREVAQYLGVDAALVSKFESGNRRPTRKQVIALSSVLDIPQDVLLTAWLKEIILNEVENESVALQALQAAEEDIKYRINSRNKLSYPSEIKSLLSEIDLLKKEVDKHRHMDSYRIAQALELEYTYESNRIEGNTLTLKETDLVVNEGLTISGKSMREHLEAINHKDAVEYIKFLVDKNSEMNEQAVLTVHNLILRGIDVSNAGKYRHVQVMIKGSRHVPPQPYMVAKFMEDFFIWFQQFRTVIHPLVLAAEVHERLVTIHPFIDGNGRTSRLLMNLILLKHGYVIANLKGDSESRLAYYNALEKAQTNGDKSDFIKLIAQTELNSINRYLSVIKGQA